MTSPDQRHDDLELVHLDVHATEGVEAARVAAYGDAWSRGFHEGSLGDQQRAWWLEHSRADDVSLRAAYPARSLADPPAPVATFTSWRGEVNVGGGALLPLRMITDVTVAPTHRRRGLLHRLMSDDLAAAARAGLPLAALTVSEGGIYGRFGFGVATRRRQVEVDVAPGRFALRDPHDDGSLELLEPAQARPHAERVFARVLATRRGELARPAMYAQIEAGLDFRTGAPDRKARTVVHLDAAGEVDGYARFVHEEQDGGTGGTGTGTVAVRALQATTDTAWRRLWRFLAEVDLAQRVTALVPVDTALPAALADPRAVRTTGLHDMLWLRVLDPVAALEARPWRADGSVVLEVDDALGHAAGRFRLTTEGGRAQVERTDRTARDDRAAEVRVEADTLAALYLGDQTVPALVAAGRVRGPGADTFGAMADHAGPAPYCTVGF